MCHSSIKPTIRRSFQIYYSFHLSLPFIPSSLSRIKSMSSLNHLTAKFPKTTLHSHTIPRSYSKNRLPRVLPSSAGFRSCSTSVEEIHEKRDPLFLGRCLSALSRVHLTKPSHRNQTRRERKRSCTMSRSSKWRQHANEPRPAKNVEWVRDCKLDLSKENTEI